MTTATIRGILWSMFDHRIDAVFIDFYGTIAAGDREIVESVCRRIVQDLELPTPAEHFAVRWGERFFQTLDHANHNGFRSLYECETRSLTETLAEYGRTADPAPYVAELEEYWANPPVYADALEFLRQLKRPVCCVSNADEGPLHAAIRRHRLTFTTVVSSESARCYKPAGRIFQQALDALGTHPQGVVHIGDSLHSDVAGASALGIRTVWLERESRIHDIGLSQPGFIIYSLAELTGRFV